MTDEPVTREDIVRVELVRQGGSARRKLVRGTALIALLPAVACAAIITLFAFDSWIPLMLGATYVLVGGAAGVSLVVSGTLDRRAALRALREYDEQRRLPVARVVERAPAARRS